ncbi:MAG: sigma-70 family RNA polymerase sigma factor [Eubacteriales bacterium]
MQDKKTKLHQEIDNLITLVKAGDSDAFSKLAEKYEPMLLKARSTCISEELSEYDIQDIKQEELIAFYRAIISYDVAQSDVEFGLYAKICVTNSMISYKRAIRRKSHDISFVGDDMYNFTDPDGEIQKMYEMRESERELGEQIERTLSPYENEVWSYYVNGFSTKEIAIKLNCSEKSIDNAIFRIRKKLRTLRKT